jgi:hypothetical protein
MEEFDWSEWYPLSYQSLTHLPDVPGIYEIRTDYEFGRLRGSSRVVYIGSAAGRGEPTLRKRLGKRISDPEGNLSGAEKLLQSAGHTLEFRFAKAVDRETAREMEKRRLTEYEEEHWEAPPGVHKRLG